jgi:hypothetical protein
MPAASPQSVFEPPALEKGWQRAEAPELFKFEKRGDQIIGVLNSISRIEIESQDNPGEKQSVTQYLVTPEDGKPVKFLATYDLLQKISRRMVGCKVRVTLLGEDERIRRGNNRMKVFDVQYKGTLRAPDDAHANSGPITDEDIPF